MKNKLWLVIVLMAVNVGVGVAQTPQSCPLTNGPCVFDILVGTRGAYEQYEFRIGPDAANMSPVTFAIVQPTTSVSTIQLGITRQMNPASTLHESTITLRDADGNILASEVIKLTLGGDATPQNFVYQICALDTDVTPVAPLCGAERPLTLT